MIENDSSSVWIKKYTEYDEKTQRSIYSLALYAEHKFIRGKFQVMTNNDR